MSIKTTIEIRIFSVESKEKEKLEQGRGKM